MPWAAGDVDKHRKGLNPAQKAKWVAIANGVMKDCMGKGGDDKRCAPKAIRIANSKFDDEIELIKMLSDDLPDDVCPECINEFIEDALELIPGEDVLLASAADKKKPGGSNAGEYKPSEGPFCGPSGGAPSGTYPVGTRKRAIAAIAYARNAPNPSGIKACVCKHWGDLATCKGGKKKQEMQEVPGTALQFTDENCFAKVSMEGESGPPQLEMTIYSGGVITNHWFWGNLGIDLAGMKFPKKSYPLLEQHQIDKKIGFMGKPKVVDGKLTVNPKSVQFVDTPESQQFIKLSQEGFPFESSMYALPTKIERVADGETTEFNGLKVKGPGTVWRESVFKEGSVCVFGADSNTQSKVFGGSFQDVTIFVESPYEYSYSAGHEDDKKGGSKKMTLEELKKEHPDLVAEFTKEIETQFNQEKDDLVTKFQTQIDKTNQKLTELAEKNLSLEKLNAIRAEKDRQETAASIVENLLSESKVPSTLYAKVKRQIDYTKFVKDEVLDVEAFTKSITDEIVDWETLVGDKVLGFGGNVKEIVPTKPDPNELTEEDKKWAEKMLAFAGQTK